MASLFKRPYTKPIPPDAEIVTHKGKRCARFQDESGKAVVAPLTKKGDRFRLFSAKWYGQYIDANGKLQRVPLSTDKTAAQQMLNELVRKAELGKVGICHPFAEHRKHPWAEHLAAFEADLRAKGSSPKQVMQLVSRARRVLEGCRFVFVADLSPSRVQTFLAELRQDGPPLPELDPNKEWYTKAELATSLGAKPAALSKMLYRHRPEATGQGKARRHPPAPAEAL